MLTGAQCRNAELREELYRLNATSRALSRNPTFRSEGRAWHYRFTLNGKISMFALGEHPSVRIAEARERCETACKLVKQGINPAK